MDAIRPVLPFDYNYTLQQMEFDRSKHEPSVTDINDSALYRDESLSFSDELERHIVRRNPG